MKLCKRIQTLLLLFAMLGPGKTNAQCTNANVNWDNLDYLISTGNYSPWVTAAMAQTQYKALKQEPIVVDNLDDLERSSVILPVTRRHSYINWIMGIVLSVSLLLNMLHYIPILFQRHEPQYNGTYGK